eukprot:GGOE01042489.1.p1 GENE.GGOE01042489.1~~GGOE01042489.1.p1  ORF type:complete len:512 (+),score=124.98 GGOE01042489.1:64-1599(+)
MAVTVKQLPKQHEWAKLQFQSSIKFQCAQPPMLSMPTMFRPTFDPFQFAQYRPTSLDSTNSQVSFLGDDLSLPDLVDPSSYVVPEGISKNLDGAPLLDAADVELLPDNQVDHQLRKLLGRQKEVPVWLRNTEYTELPVRQDGLVAADRTRRRTLTGKRPVEISEEFIDLGEEDTLEEGIEHSFDLAMTVDKEFNDHKSAAEAGESSSRQWLVHPNPAKRQATPVGVWHVFPHYAMWRTQYVAVNFMEGNPIHVDRLVPPGTTFSSLSEQRQSELYAASQAHDDSLLLPLQEVDDAAVSHQAAVPNRPLTFLIPRVPRSRQEADQAESDEDEDEQEQPPKKRYREYERVADFLPVDDMTLGRKEKGTTLKDRDMCLIFADSEGVSNYVKLEAQIHLRRRVLWRGEADHKAGKLYVVEPRPLTTEERLERDRRHQRLTSEGDEGPASGPTGPLESEEPEESAEFIIQGILASHGATTTVPTAVPRGDDEVGEEDEAPDDASTVVPEEADMGEL